MKNYFTKEDILLIVVAEKCIEKIFNITLAIREMKIYAMVSYHCIPVRIAKIKKITMLNTDEDTKKLDLSRITGRNMKQNRHWKIT